MRIRRTQRAELPQPENIGGQSVFAPALPVLYTWSCELSQELAGGSSVWNGLCCALSLGRPSLSRHSCHSMWDSRQAGYRTNTHGKLPLCLWTMTEKEQEEKGKCMWSGNRMFSLKKNRAERLLQVQLEQFQMLAAWSCEVIPQPGSGASISC